MRLRWRCFVTIGFVMLYGARSWGQVLAEVPAEIASHHFTVSIDGQSSPVMHAAQNLYFLNFAINPRKRLKISVTADRDDFWAKGVEVQPWRLGIRPRREGRTITFQLDKPAKISISRPNDYLGDAEMLYLFANAPEADAPKGPAPGVRFFGAGIHRENIDAASGDTIYLAPGAVMFGSLNIWEVDKVRVFGRGVIVYDGPQNPKDDDGWMHKRNWHCIVMDKAHEISVEGITCVVRSRTWQVQMKDSRGIRFENVKIIGANAGNANADGMDWLGGGDTIVKDSFLRAADDIFAMQGSWEGYGPTAFAVNGEPVTNVTIEDSVLSTSISNVVRAGWPEKNFEGGHFVMRDSDVLHMGMGGCGIPFALMEIWADPNGRGRSADFRFEDVRLEDWYSLTQLMEPVEGIDKVQFKDVFGVELPSMVPSLLKGRVTGTSFDNAVLGGALLQSDADVPVNVTEGAGEPVYVAGGPRAEIRFAAGLIRPGKKVKFEAVTPAGLPTEKWTYEWSFGDGSRATGRKVKHKFPDTAGTLWDGSGRFRVLLHITDAAGRTGWIYAPVIATEMLKPAVSGEQRLPGLVYRSFAMERPELAEIESAGSQAATGVSARFEAAGLRPRAEGYGISFDGFVDAPADGGYSFTLLSNDAGRIAIDGQVLGETPAPCAQVCGLKGNAVRQVTGTIALAKGRHRIAVVETHSVGEEGFRVWWRGPGMSAAKEIPPAALSHTEAADRSDQQGRAR